MRASYTRLLAVDELTRLRRFRADGAALQYLVGRVLLRTVLSRYVDVEPIAWRFETNAHGRPRLVQPNGVGLDFNLSHTDGLVACAVTRETELEIGIDVERVQRATAIEGVERYVFAPAEAAYVAAAPPEKRPDLFLAYWTLKEAYVKARGLGLSLPLDGFAFDLSGPAPRISFSDRCPDDPGRWSFLQGRPTPEHRLALAVSRVSRVETTWRWTLPLAGAEYPNVSHPRES